jgi:hypothetical protein
MAKGYVSRSVRFTPELYEMLRRVAFEQERSINNCIVDAVAQWLSEQKQEAHESPH